MRARKRNGRLTVAGLGVLVLALSSCSAAHRPEVSETERLAGGWPKTNLPFRERELPVLQVSLPAIAKAELVNDDDLCATCHESYVKLFATNVHRDQKCEGCHGPASEHLRTRGKEPGLILSFKTLAPAERSELCLKCHEQQQCAPGLQWRTSVHAHSGVSCTDCHKGHYNVPPGTPATTAPGGAAAPTVEPVSLVQAQAKEQKISLKGTSNNMGAVAPTVCYQCHQEMQDLERIAHPHQVLGQNGFNCTTCHDPHGKINEASRSNLCLDCHQGTPNMAWHSSPHSLNGVACTDCHNPHPKASVARIVNVSHTAVERPKRLPMSVEEPAACYKCHPQIYAKNAMPSHHPIKEGKMTCSDCHDPHGQAFGNLKEAATVNMVCYKCHAEKQGPFAYEHPPVTENCAICHDPHGAVANNLLRQPASFLCLRCHTGHRTSPLGPNHAALLGDVGTSSVLQRAFFTDCTQCHHQIHGSDLPTPHVPHGFMR